MKFKEKFNLVNPFIGQGVITARMRTLIDRKNLLHEVLEKRKTVMDKIQRNLDEGFRYDQLEIAFSIEAGRMEADRVMLQDSIHTLVDLIQEIDKELMKNSYRHRLTIHHSHGDWY